MHPNARSISEAVADRPLLITALLHRYASLLDGGDLDGVAALFEHATWTSVRLQLRGSAEARTAYSGVILYEDGTPRTKHVITNVVIDELPPDRATAASYFTVLQAIEGLPLQPIIADRSGSNQVEPDGLASPVS